MTLFSSIGAPSKAKISKISEEKGELKDNEELKDTESREDCITPNDHPEGEGYEFRSEEFVKVITDKIKETSLFSSNTTNTSSNTTEEKVITKNQDDQSDSTQKVKYALSVTEIEDLIIDKNKKRKIDCRVILDDVTGKNFKAFLQQQQINQKECKDQRIQILYKLDSDDSDHWTTLDVLVTKTKIQIFYLDSAGDPRHVIPISFAVLAFENTELTYCEDQIQHDGESCSIFSMDHAFHLSKIQTIHTTIDESKKEMGCDLLVMELVKTTTKPTYNNIDKLTTNHNVALVQFNKELFYIDKKNKICTDLADAINQFPISSKIAFIRFDDNILYIDQITNKFNLITSVASETIHELDSYLEMKKQAVNKSRSLSENEINYLTNITKISPDPRYKKLYTMEPIDLPAVLVKNAQSFSFLKRYETENQNKMAEKINKKGQTLAEYTQAHKFFHAGLKKHVNLAIQYKEVVYKNRLAALSKK